VFDTTDPSTWSLLTSSWVVPAPDGSWQTTFVAPASIPYHYVTVRTFCGWLPQAQTALVVRPLPLEPPGATGAILVTPLVSPMPAPAGSLVSVSNPAGQPCAASGVFVALFDTTNPDVWSLASSAWAPTVEGNWPAPLTIPSTAGDHYVVRTFCNGTTQHDVPLTVVG
jgi:hypothetical protein